MKGAANGVKTPLCRSARRPPIHSGAFVAPGRSSLCSSTYGGFGSSIGGWN